MKNLDNLTEIFYFINVRKHVHTSLVHVFQYFECTAITKISNYFINPLFGWQVFPNIQLFFFQTLEPDLLRSLLSFHIGKLP